MRRRLLFTVLCLLILIDGAGIVFSHHGLLDMMKFDKVIEFKLVELSALERENRELKRRFDLFSSLQSASLDIRIKTFFGWVRPDELVYFEKEY